MNAPQIDRSPTGDGSVHRWAMPRWWLPFVVGILVVLLVAGSLLSVRIVEDEGWAGAAFLTVWFAALAWNLYWWLFRVAYRLELRGGRCTGVLQSHKGDLLCSPSPGCGRSWERRIRCRLSGRSDTGNVPVFAYGDLSSFLARLNVINTAVPDRVRGFAGLYDRVTGRTRTTVRSAPSNDTSRCLFEPSPLLRHASAWSWPIARSMLTSYRSPVEWRAMSPSHLDTTRLRCRRAPSINRGMPLPGSHSNGRRSP